MTSIVSVGGAFSSSDILFGGSTELSAECFIVGWLVTFAGPSCKLTEWAVAAYLSKRWVGEKKPTDGCL